jgi:hypothetical protein
MDSATAAVAVIVSSLDDGSGSVGFMLPPFYPDFFPTTASLLKYSINYSKVGRETGGLAGNIARYGIFSTMLQEVPTLL